MKSLQPAPLLNLSFGGGHAMLRSACLVPALPVLVLMTLPGCGRSQRQWEVTVENQAEAPCSFFVTLGADGGGAQVEDVAKGEAITLIVGNTPTVVQTVRVVRGREEQTLSPKVELPVGKRYAVVVGADGTVKASASDR
jgi:hypothetical protein